MSQISFTRWCVDPRGRIPVSVNPTRVESTEWFSDSFRHGGTDEEFPAATKIIMRNKTEYVVQGNHAEVTAKLNAQEA